jgi:hypothetical protein
LKIEWFQEFEGQSYPVLEFEVEIRTLARVFEVVNWTLPLSKCMILLSAEVLSTKITPLKQKVEVTEGGDAMEE